MSEMVERVARAICDVENSGYDDCTCIPGTCSHPKQLEAARAALTAMREPTIRMLVHAVDHMEMQEAVANRIDHMEMQEAVANRIWHRMIGAALGD